MKGKRRKMNKKVLSKKVMISLLTMSCVYLGGISGNNFVKNEKH